MIRQIVFAAAFTMLAAPAFAAHHGYIHSPIVVSRPAAYDWTGVYVGAVAGYADSSISYDNPGTPHQSLGNAAIGGRAGVNYQFRNGIVVGADVTILATPGASDRVRDGNYIVERGRSQWTAMAKGRLGYAMGRFLPYVTAGVAFRDLDQGESCPAPAVARFGFCSKHGPFNLNKSHLQVGPVVGVGLEYAVTDRLSVYAEYAHAFWGKTSYVLFADAKGQPLPVSRARSGTDLVLVGLNYRFW